MLPAGMVSPHAELDFDVENQTFALPTPSYDQHPDLAPFVSRITEEVRREALAAFIPAMRGVLYKLQRARDRQFDARIAAGDDLLQTLQRDGTALLQLDAPAKQWIRDYLAPIVQAILERLETLARIKFADGMIPLEPREHPQLFVEVERALEDCGALPVFSAYAGERLGLLRLAVQVNTARETRLKYGEIDAQGLPRLKTTYFHVDSTDWPAAKALIYLSDVERDHGPFRYVKGSHRLMDHFEAAVRKTNDRLKQPAIRFLALPRKFGQHACFGDHIDETSPGAAELLDNELVVCDGRSDLVLFDNNGVHRGGFVRSGHRLMLQCQFGAADRMAERNEGSAAARSVLQTA